LLRQKNESEIRCGSARLNDRRAFYFGGPLQFSELVKTSPTAQQVFPSLLAPTSAMVGLSLEAVPFCLSTAPVRDFRPDKKHSFRLELQLIVDGQDARTTVMIKNIPNKYTQKMLLERIDTKHFGRYDFFYLPIDLKNNCNVGYAFINMSDPIFVVALYEDLHGQTWERFNSEKICELTYGRIQGKHALVDNFQSAVDLRKVKPAVFQSRPATEAEHRQIRASYESLH
jgi:hypothetical protein